MPLQDVHFKEVQYPGRSFSVNDFTVTFVKGRHATILGMPVVPGRIRRELRLPCSFTQLREGEHTYCIKIEHELGSILNLGSANFLPGSLGNVPADYLILGIAGYDSKFSGSFQADFFDEVVRRTDPKRVFFSHWDDFGEPLDRPPKWVYGSLPGRGPTWSVDYFKGKKYQNTETGSEVPVELLPLWRDIHLPAV